MKASAVLLLTLPLAACAGSRTHFHTLAPVPAAALPARPACSGPPIEVRHVSLPGTLDREAVVRADSAESLDVSSADRWAGPLQGMIQRVIAQDLRRRLPGQQVLLPGDAPPASGATGLSLNIQYFAGDAAGEVSLQADWTVTSRSGSSLLTRTNMVDTQAASPAVADVVTAMSRALGAFADPIAAKLRHCPGEAAEPAAWFTAEQL